jgi:hypothetical protein
MPIRRSRRPAQARRPPSTAHPGATVQVKAVVADTPGANGSFTAYYRFDHPSIRTESDPISYAVDPDHTRDQPAPDQTPTSTWPGNQVQDELLARLTDIAAATPITILGYASFEAHDNPAVGGTDWIYNNSLANNRAAGLAAIIAKDQSTTFTAVTAKADMSNWGPAQGDPERNLWWKAVASWQAQTLPGTTTIGSVSRPSAQPRNRCRCRTTRRTLRRRRHHRGSRRSTSRSASCATTSSPPKSPASSTSRRRRKSSSRKAA